MSASLMNSGKYTCLAHNEAGYTTSDNWVFVIGKIIIRALTNKILISMP